MWKNYSDEIYNVPRRNNLYGWAMIQYLPTGGFKWLTEDETRSLDLSKYHEDSEERLMLEVGT